MSRKPTEESKHKARDFIAERLKKHSGMTSEKAHREAADVARRVERKNQEK